MSVDDYSTIFQNSNVPIGVVSLGGTFLDCNKAFIALAGRDVDFFVGVPKETGSMVKKGKPSCESQPRTLFNIVPQEEAVMDAAYTQISSLLPSEQATKGESTPHPENPRRMPPPLQLPGVLRPGGECNLVVSLVRNDNDEDKYFCVHLMPTAEQKLKLVEMREEDRAKESGGEGEKGGEGGGGGEGREGGEGGEEEPVAVAPRREDRATRGCVKYLAQMG